MALLSVSRALRELPSQVVLFLVIAVLLVSVITLLCYLFSPSQLSRTVYDHACFCWNCFLKPHTGHRPRNQQDALESFYKAQASIYDSTRMRLLRGRDDMLGLVAAQMRHRVDSGALDLRPVWVDVGCSQGITIRAESC